MKVETALDNVTLILKSWSCVQAITVMDYQDDIYDPYFFLSLDVYLDGPLPNETIRREAFSDTGAFEPGTIGTKDRFILHDMPFRLEYKKTNRFDDIAILSANGRLRDSGTYHLYRLVHSRILFERTAWISTIRGAIAKLPDAFWTNIRLENQTKMEHYLNDLGAAVLREDILFFTVSSAGFLKSMCSTLYALNKKLEPSARYFSSEVNQLPELPDAFSGTLESFLRLQETSLSRKYEIAQILAKKIIHI